MKSRKHIVVLAAIAIYGVVIGFYQYKTQNAELSSLLLTWGVMAVLLVLLFFLFRRMEALRERNQFKDEIKATDGDDDEDDSAFRLPKDN